VNEAITAGGESYFRYRQIEMLPQVVPAIAEALSEAKLVTIATEGHGAADSATGNIMGVIQTVIAAQLLGRGGALDGVGSAPASVAPAPALGAPPPLPPSRTK